MVDLSVSSNFHAHDDAMYAMTLTRTRTVWRGGGKWEDADVSRRTTAKTPKTLSRRDLDYEHNKLTDFTIVARSLSRSDETAQSKSTTHIPRHSLDDDDFMCTEPGEESAFNAPQEFLSGREVLDLPTASCGSVGGRHTRRAKLPSLRPVARPSGSQPGPRFLSEARVCFG